MSLHDPKIIVATSCTTHDQSWGRYIKNVTSYLLLITFFQFNILQLHITFNYNVTSYLLLATLSNVIYYSYILMQ